MRKQLIWLTASAWAFLHCRCHSRNFARLSLTDASRNSQFGKIIDFFFFLTWTREKTSTLTTTKSFYTQSLHRSVKWRPMPRRRRSQEKAPPSRSLPRRRKNSKRRRTAAECCIQSGLTFCFLHAPLSLFPRSQYWPCSHLRGKSWFTSKISKVSANTANLFLPHHFFLRLYDQIPVCSQWFQFTEFRVLFFSLRTQFCIRNSTVPLYFRPS